MDTLLQDLRYAARTLDEEPRLRGAHHHVPGARHRGEQHDLQRGRHRGDPAAAVPRSRPSGLAAHDASGQRHRPRRRLLSGRSGLEGADAHVRRHRDGHRTQPDAVGRRRARAIQRRDGDLEHVSDDRRPADPRPPDSPGRRHARRAARGAPQPRRLAAPLRRRSVGHRPHDHGQRQPAHDHRRHAAEVSVSRTGAALDPADADRVRQPAHRAQPAGDGAPEAGRVARGGAPRHRRRRRPARARAARRSRVGSRRRRRCATTWCPTTSGSSCSR